MRRGRGGKPKRTRRRGEAVPGAAPHGIRTKSFLGRLKDILEVKGKITDPAVPPEDWKHRK